MYKAFLLHQNGYPEMSKRRLQSKTRTDLLKRQGEIQSKITKLPKDSDKRDDLADEGRWIDEKLSTKR